AVRSYRQAMTNFAGMRNLDLWYTRLDVADVARRFAQQATSAEVRRFNRNVARARAKDSLHAFGKLTRVVDGQVRIVSDPPLIVPVEELAEQHGHEIDDYMQLLIRSYRRTLEGDRRHLLERFRYLHAARKVVGVGSVGTRVWILLLLGRDNGDPLFLQAKEAEASVLEPFIGRSRFQNHGQRVVVGQRLVPAA